MAKLNVGKEEEAFLEYMNQNPSIEGLTDLMLGCPKTRSIGLKYFENSEYVIIDLDKIWFCILLSPLSNKFLRLGFRLINPLLPDIILAANKSISKLKVNKWPTAIIDLKGLFVGKKLKHIKINDATPNNEYLKNHNELATLDIFTPLKFSELSFIPSSIYIHFYQLEMDNFPSAGIMSSLDFSATEKLDIDGYFRNSNFSLKNIIINHKFENLFSLQKFPKLKSLNVDFKIDVSERWGQLKFFILHFGPTYFNAIPFKMKGKIAFIVNVVPEHVEKFFDEIKTKSRIYHAGNGLMKIKHIIHNGLFLEVEFLLPEGYYDYNDEEEKEE